MIKALRSITESLRQSVAVAHPESRPERLAALRSTTSSVFSGCWTSRAELCEAHSYGDCGTATPSASPAHKRQSLGTCAISTRLTVRHRTIVGHRESAINVCFRRSRMTTMGRKEALRRLHSRTKFAVQLRRPVHLRKCGTPRTVRHVATQSRRTRKRSRSSVLSLASCRAADSPTG